MKSRNKIITLFLSSTICLYGQINVGDALMPSAMNKGGKFEKENVEEFKKTTTVCFVQNKDKGKLAEYKKAASQAWNFNKIEFAIISDYSKYAGKAGYSFITITGIVADRGNASSTSSYFLKFWYPFQTKKGKMDEKVIARVDLYLDPATTGDLMYGSGNKEDKSSAMVSDQAVFYNLSPGYLKCYLAVVNKYLNEQKKHFLFEEETDPKLLKALSKDTLFLPEYIKLGSGMATGKVRDEKELLEKYEYKYKLLSNDAISNKILGANKNTFVFSYIYFGAQKFYSIFEASKGTIVYSAYESMSMKGLNEGDFKKISKQIKG